MLLYPIESPSEKPSIYSRLILISFKHAALLLSNSLNSLSNLGNLCVLLAKVLLKFSNFGVLLSDNKDSVYSQFMTVHKCYVSYYDDYQLVWVRSTIVTMVT